MIGRFPWDPFPPQEAAPSGADPLMTALCRGAIEGADAYRAVRSAVRRDGGVLRAGNRFVPDGRYREVGFVALGRAAHSMALATLHVFGDRLTQGYIAGPGEPPASVPFRSETIRDGWGGAEAAPRVIAAARELAGGLRASDLFLLLVSPGALRALLLPPPGLGSPEFAGLLEQLHRAGASGREVGEVARVLGTGGVGGALLPAGMDADALCLLVERGDGPVVLGGGPTFPVEASERAGARATLERTGALERLPATALGGLGRPTVGPPAPERRPVVVAAPPDGVRGTGDVAFDKGWKGRVGALGLGGGPAAAAAEFLQKVDDVLRAEPPGDGARSKGTAVVATTTLAVPEGVDERAAAEAFLAAARAALRRREMSVGLLRTAGAVGDGAAFAGGVVGAVGDPAVAGPNTATRPIAMPGGITDVGLLAVALQPQPAGRRGTG